MEDAEARWAKRRTAMGKEARNFTAWYARAIGVCRFASMIPEPARQSMQFFRQKHGTLPLGLSKGATKGAGKCTERGGIF